MKDRDRSTDTEVGKKCGVTSEYNAWRVQAIATARKKTGCQAMAEDIFHDAFMKMHAKPREHVPKTARQAYFMRVLNSCIHSMQRKSTSRDRKLRDAVLCGDVPSTNEKRSRLVTDRELAVDAAILKLKKVDRDILDLVYGNGWSVSEVAVELNLSTDNVSTRKYRALKFLRDAAYLPSSRTRDSRQKPTE